MALWSNTDAAASAPQYTVDVTTGNTGVQAYNVEPIGTWGVDSNEAQATNVNGHAGWVLRTVGSGGRAGRVTEETLVAMGSISTDSEDVVYPDYTIYITSQPSNVALAAGNNATFTVVATSTPSTTLAYQWSGPTGAITGATNATLTITNAQSANNGGYYVTITATGADTVVSANATLTVS